MLKCKILLDFGNPDYVVGETYDMPEADAIQLVRWGIVEILTDPPAGATAPEPPATPVTTTTTAKAVTEPADTTTAKTTTTTAK
jgi:hypothetical protein